MDRIGRRYPGLRVRLLLGLVGWCDVRDYLPDELPALSFKPEDYELMDILWDKQIEEMYWDELMTMPLEEDPNQGHVERREEKRDNIIVA